MMTLADTAIRWILLAIIAIALGCSPAIGHDWRAISRFFQPDVIRASRAELGLKAPIALFAGQIHQESLWRKNAQSQYARGLTQFTPATEKWIKTQYPKSLGDSGALNPRWAIRAMVKYDHWLYQRISAVNPCHRWAMVLSAYNGGLGWLNRDKKLTQLRGKNPRKWWGHVEHFSRRAKWAIRENRGYPKNIIYKHQRKYQRWGGNIVCGG